MLFTKRLQNDFDAQRLRVKHVYGLVNATTARQVGNDYSLKAADDAGVTWTGQVHKDHNPYQLTRFKIETDD